MRVLVTGATGLIGSAVCDALLARGEEVVGLSRDPAKARKTNPTVTWHAWDPANERPPAAALEGVDAVVNLVGEEINQRLTDEAKQRIRESRVRATKNLVDGMLAATPSPRTLVSQAAIGIYGDRGEAIVDESTAAGPGLPLPARGRVGGGGAQGRGRRRPRGGLPHRARPRPGRRAAQAAGAAVQVRGRRPARRRRLLHALDPSRRRGRPDPLGARQRGRQRHPERDRAAPGHQPRVLEVARQGAAPPLADPGAPVRDPRPARRGADRADRRQLPGDPAPSPGSRVRLPLPRARPRRSPTCSSGRSWRPAGSGRWTRTRTRSSAPASSRRGR